MRISIGLGILWIGLVGGPSAGRASIEARIDDLQSASATVRKEAAAWLGRAGDPAAAAALAAALRDPEKDVRREAAKALGFLKEEKAAAALSGALKDADANVRFYAAYALGEIKDPETAGALLAALCDPEWSVRNQAAWSLRELHDPSIGASVAALLKEPGADAAAIGWLLKQVGASNAFAPLAALLKDPDAGTRLRAATSLAELRDPAAVDALIGALSDADANVRRCSFDALRVAGDRRAAAALSGFAANEPDPSLRAAAEEAVAAMTPPVKLGAHWPFDDRGTGIAKDAMGNGTDGKISGGTPVEGRAGAGMDFDGRGGVELGKPKALPTADQPITVMAWIKARGTNGVVVARGGAFTGYSLYVKGGLPKFGMRRTAKDPAAAIAAGTSAITGGWTHLAGTIKPDCIELYVNGKLEATARTEGCLPGNCGQGMEIGFDAGSSAVEIIDHFDGVIDEVKVFQQALDADAVAAEAQTGGKR